jgi:hypothetical protein
MVSGKKRKIGACICIAVPVMVMTMGAVAALASEGNGDYMEACRSELNEHYGQEMDVSVVSKRRAPAGVEVKLAARLDQDNVEFLNCWVPKNDIAGGDFEQRSNAVAITIKPVPVIQ